MSSKSFWQRPEGMGFWVMTALTLPFAWYSSLTTNTLGWLFIVVLFITELVTFWITWSVLAWRRISNIPMEKVEQISFRVTMLSAIMILLLEYTSTFVFNNALFYVFLVGALSYSFIQVFWRRRSQA